MESHPQGDWIRSNALAANDSARRWDPTSNTKELDGRGQPIWRALRKWWLVSARIIATFTSTETVTDTTIDRGRGGYPDSEDKDRTMR